MTAFITNLPVGFQLFGYVLGGSNWLGPVLITILILAIPKLEPRLTHWLSQRYEGTPTGRLLKNPLFVWAIGGGVALLLMFMLVLGSAVNVLQPQVFAGWVSDKQLAYGRHVATITSITEGNQKFCGDAYITGDIKNVSADPLTLQFVGGLNVWSSQPSASFSAYPSLSGIYGNGAYLLPGQSVGVTITAGQDGSECQQASAEDVRRLREGRLNATGNINVTQGNRVTSALFRFEDLPIFRGD